MARVP
jgi:hypothetical protein